MLKESGKKISGNIQLNEDMNSIQNTGNIGGEGEREVKPTIDLQEAMRNIPDDIQKAMSNTSDEPGRRWEVGKKSEIKIWDKPKKPGSSKQYFKDIERFLLLDKEDEIRLAQRIKEGDEQDREDFINANLRLVVSIARRFVNRYRGYGILLDDLIQQGNLGLINAVDRFDPKRGIKFSTYATEMIKGMMMNMSYKQPRLISVPFNIQWLFPRIYEVNEKHLLEFGKMPTEEHLAKEIGVTVGQIIKAKKAASIKISSLDAPSTEGVVGPDVKEDFIKGKSSLEHEAFIELFREKFRKELEHALDLLYLADRQQQQIKENYKKKIFSLRYGLGGDHPYTLPEIGEEFEISKQRAEQIVKEVYTKLLQKNPQLKEQLERFEFFAKIKGKDYSKHNVSTYLKGELKHALGHLDLVDLRVEKGRQVREDREKKIFRLRYGLDDRPYTLAEIGEKFRISGARVGQIEKKVEAKLLQVLQKNPQLKEQLNDLLFLAESARERDVGGSD